jgi:hypothetical protein
MRLYTICCVIGSFALWAHAIPARADTFASYDVITDPTPARFSVCSEHTCKKVTITYLEQEQWQQVRAQFSTGAESPAQEREYIARAVALMEVLVGKRVGTGNDKGRNFKGVGMAGQTDCIDESTNTSIYLIMMAQDGLLKWHTVEDRVTRGWFIFGWPHTTAVVRDTANEEPFAVDSWFHDSGALPDIVPLALWKDGWDPADDE